jgi:hypothetical protein
VEGWFWFGVEAEDLLCSCEEKERVIE